MLLLISVLSLCFFTGVLKAEKTGIALTTITDDIKVFASSY